MAEKIYFFHGHGVLSLRTQYKKALNWGEKRLFSQLFYLTRTKSKRSENSGKLYLDWWKQIFHARFEREKVVKPVTDRHQNKWVGKGIENNRELWDWKWRAYFRKAWKLSETAWHVVSRINLWNRGRKQKRRVKSVPTRFLPVWSKVINSAFLAFQWRLKDWHALDTNSISRVSKSCTTAWKIG